MITRMTTSEEDIRQQLQARCFASVEKMTKEASQPSPVGLPAVNVAIGSRRTPVGKRELAGLGSGLSATASTFRPFALRFQNCATSMYYGYSVPQSAVVME
jgi:hypothetical protein